MNSEPYTMPNADQEWAAKAATVQTQRPIARQPRLLTERGRMLILRRRRQLARGERRADMWDHLKAQNFVGRADDPSFADLARYFLKTGFTPVARTGWRAKAKAAAAKAKAEAEAAQKVAA